MSDGRRLALASALCLAAGLIVGVMVGRATAPTAPAATEPAAIVETDRSDAEAEKPVETPLPRPPRKSGQCEECEIALRFMQAHSQQDSDRDNVVRRPFPTEGFEQTDAWTKLVEHALDECALEGLSLDFIDCQEYPCLAALRRSESKPMRLAERRREELHINDAFEHCPALADAFGGEAPPADAIAAIPFQVQCPDHRVEDLWVLAVLDPAGQAYDDYTSDSTDDQEIARITRWIYRRANDIERAWTCHDEPTAN